MTATAPEILSRTPGRVTVAMKDEDDGALRVVKLAAGQSAFADEVTARKLLAEAGLPVASPLIHHEDGPSMLVLPWEPGEPFGPHHSHAVAERIGELLARVHTVDAGEKWGANDTWTAWMQGWLFTVTQQWRSMRPAQAEQAGLLNDALERLASSMERACRGAILFDGRPEHFRVDSEGGIRMIDVEHLRNGDPAMDVAVLSLWVPDSSPAVLSGFARAGGDLGGDLPQRVRWYGALRAVSAAVWHRDQLGDEKTAEGMLDRAAQFCAEFDAHPET